MSKQTYQKQKSMSFRLSESEAHAIRKQAAAEDISVSELVRDRVLASTGVLNTHSHQKYYQKRMEVAEEFSKLKKIVNNSGYQINLDSLERSIYQLCL